MSSNSRFTSGLEIFSIFAPGNSSEAEEHEKISTTRGNNIDIKIFFFIFYSFKKILYWKNKIKSGWSNTIITGTDYYPTILELKKGYHIVLFLLLRQCFYLPLYKNNYIKILYNCLLIKI